MFIHHAREAHHVDGSFPSVRGPGAPRRTQLTSVLVLSNKTSHLLLTLSPEPNNASVCTEGHLREETGIEARKATVKSQVDGKMAGLSPGSFCWKFRSDHRGSRKGFTDRWVTPHNRWPEVHTITVFHQEMLFAPAEIKNKGLCFLQLFFCHCYITRWTG